MTSGSSVDLPDDVSLFIAQHFPEREQATVREVLAHAPIDGTGQSPDRILRCVVVASRGSLESLRYHVSLLSVDWRDVIVAGEYEVREGRLVRFRNLNERLTGGWTA